MLIAPSHDSVELFNPRIVSLLLGESTESSLQMITAMNFTNPTQYTAHIPFFDVLLLYNNTPVAHVIARNFSLAQGNNSDSIFEISWNPLEIGGPSGVEAGRSLISSYISGKSDTIA